jgi:hypothetical protein
MSVFAFIGEKPIREQTRSQKNFSIEQQITQQWKEKFDKLFILSNFVSSATILLSNFFHYLLVQKCETNDFINESIINKRSIENFLGFFLGKIIK